MLSASSTPRRRSFVAISTYFDQLIAANQRRLLDQTLPRIVDVALQLPQLCSQPLPLLRKQARA